MAGQFISKHFFGFLWSETDVSLKSLLICLPLNTQNKKIGWIEGIFHTPGTARKVSMV